MPEEPPPKVVLALNRFLVGELREFVGPSGVRYRRYWRDGREFFERAYADGELRVDEIDAGVQRLFDEMARENDPASFEALLQKRTGVRLPHGDDRPN